MCLLMVNCSWQSFPGLPSAETLVTSHHMQKSDKQNALVVCEEWWPCPLSLTHLHPWVAVALTALHLQAALVKPCSISCYSSLRTNTRGTWPHLLKISIQSSALSVTDQSLPILAPVSRKNFIKNCVSWNHWEVCSVSCYFGC